MDTTGATSVPSWMLYLAAGIVLGIFIGREL